MPRKARAVRRRRPRVARRRKANQSSGHVKAKHYARITEVANFSAPLSNTDVNYAFSLQQFVRAMAVSKNFKYFRAKRVVWTYIPDYNTFQSGTATVSMPQMSMIMNRTGDNTLWTPAEYDAQGAVPKTFISKRVIAYKPNLVQSIQYTINPTLGTNSGHNLGARPLYNEWIATGDFTVSQLPAGSLPTLIPTINETVQYYGHSIYWEVTNTATELPPLGRVFCEVEWEFKDPLYNAPSSS